RSGPKRSTAAAASRASRRRRLARPLMLGVAEGTGEECLRAVAVLSAHPLLSSGRTSDGDAGDPGPHPVLPTRSQPSPSVLVERESEQRSRFRVWFLERPRGRTSHPVSAVTGAGQGPEAWVRSPSRVGWRTVMSQDAS